jgi:hypothetical protein
MGASEEPRKIQDVIDNVNNTWGEEHETKSKKIFWGNIIWRPLKVFSGISVIYLAGMIYYSILAAIPGVNPKQEMVQSWGYVFNVPYFLFDVRASMIISLASILLSLYVSVGKFADNDDSISGDAKRAVYRGFAKSVSGIIFAVFILNFWHGLFAGYFQGTSYAPEILGGWKNGPGWGKLIVPSDMDLSRYGDVPLWSLLFLSWFTLSSALLLTQNEKDVLIRNASFLQKINRIRKDDATSLDVEYKLAQDFWEESQESNPRPFRLGYKYGTAAGYASRFAFDSTYSVFKFRTNLISYRKIGEVRSILILWIFFIVAFALISVSLVGFLDGILFTTVTIFLSSVIEVFICWKYTGYLHKDIRLFTVSQLGTMEKILLRLRFFFVETLNKIIIRLSFSMISILGFFIFLGRAFQNGILEDEISKWYLWFAMFILASNVAIYLLSFFLRDAVKCIYINEIKDYSIKFVSVDFSNQYDARDIKYLFVAYIYCLMLKIDEYYSDYKSEIRVIESKATDGESLGDESDIKEKPECKL